MKGIILAGGAGTRLHPLTRAMSTAELHIELFGRGTAWLETGTHDSLLQASTFIQTIEERQGLKVACPEEIAFRKRRIDRDLLERMSVDYGKSSYGQYLRELLMSGDGAGRDKH